MLELSQWSESLQQAFQSDPNSLSSEPITLIAITLIALAACSNMLWRFTGLTITVVHETGHAIAALSTGGKLQGIRINWDHSGDTRYFANGFFVFRAWIAWWGYAFVPLMGLILIKSAIYGYQSAALLLLLFVSVVIFLQIRNFMAFITISLTFASLVLAWFYLPSVILAMAFYGVGVFLLFGGLRSIIELGQIHMSGGGEGSDARALQGIFLLPSLVWVGLFALATLYFIYQSFSSLFDYLAL